MQGQLDVIGTPIEDFNVALFVLENPGKILVFVGGVNADQEVVLLDSIDNDVVHESAIRIEKGGILCLSVRQTRGIVAGDPLNQAQSVGSGNLQLPHVTHVEKAGGVANREMFLERAAILHGQPPSGEVDHSGAQFLVDRAERGFSHFHGKSSGYLKITFSVRV